MEGKVKMILIFFTVSVIIGIIADFSMAAIFSTYFAGDPGQQTAAVLPPYLAMGFGAGAFSILLLLYPIHKLRDRTNTWEDFR